MRATNHNHRLLPRTAITAAAVLLLQAALMGAAAAQTTQPSATPTAATTRIITPGIVAGGRINLAANKSVVVTTTVPYKRVNVAQPDVVDFNTIGDQTILLTAKKAGTTQLIVWDDAERSEIIDVTVTLDTSALADEIRAMFPDSKIEITSSGAGTVALRGRAKNLEEAEQIVQVAAPHAPRVLNFIEVAGGQQVLLQVKFAEVSRSATNALGVNLGYTDGASFAGSNVGQVSPLGIREFGDESVDLGIPSPTGAVSLFGRASLGGAELGYFISALRQNNLLRVLPNRIWSRSAGRKRNSSPEASSRSRCRRRAPAGSRRSPSSTATSV